MSGCGCSETKKNNILKINVLEIIGGELMWFKAKKGYDGIEVEYNGKYYKFYENKPTEAPKGIEIHKFLEETTNVVEAVTPVNKETEYDFNVEDRKKKKEVKNADIS